MIRTYTYGKILFTATCPEIFHKSDATIVHDQSGNIVRNDERVVSGTKVNITCARGYIKSNIFEESDTLECLPNGSWLGNFTDCISTNGSRYSILPLSHHGDATTVDRFPWHVGIYNNTDKVQRCGGSIIAKQIIISALHCFWNQRSGKNELHRYDKFKVVAGKTYRAYDAVQDAEFAQERNIINIFYHPT